jgi:hypothetical protein
MSFPRYPTIGPVGEGAQPRRGAGLGHVLLVPVEQRGHGLLVPGVERPLDLGVEGWRSPPGRVRVEVEERGDLSERFDARPGAERRDVDTGCDDAG